MSSGQSKSPTSLQRIVHLFLEEGFQLTPDALDFLSKKENPVEAAKSILKHVTTAKEKPVFVTSELVKAVIFKPVKPEYRIYDYKTLEGKLVEDWTFADADTHYLTHGLHPYPARMIPQIARRLISRYSSRGDVVLDPFCGSGGVLVESRLLGRNSVGTDINPLAIILAKAKTTPIEFRKLNTGIKKVQTKIKEITNPDPPEFPNISYWFKDYVIKDLSVVYNAIGAVEDSDVLNFLKVSFSRTVFEVSSSRKDEHKTRLMPKEELEKFHPDVFKTFDKIIKDSVRRMGHFYDQAINDVYSEPIIGDARRVPLKDGSVDLIVTSPPYGDHRTTIHYGRWSKLSLMWLGYDSKVASAVDNVSSVGARRVWMEDVISLSDILTNYVERVKEKNVDRAADVTSYFHDLSVWLDETSRIMRPKGRCCIVIGGRNVSGLRCPTPEIIVEIAEHLNIKKERLIGRRIPSRVQPTVFMKGKLMTQEHIIILQKEP